MKNYRISKGIMFFFIFIPAVFLFGFLVMWLWNAILPAVLGVKAITFLQALGLLVLSKILFGGFGGNRWGGGYRWKQKMKERWSNMSPDERENFKAEWMNRCGGRWKMHGQADTTVKPEDKES